MHSGAERRKGTKDLTLLISRIIKIVFPERLHVAPKRCPGQSVGLTGGKRTGCASSSSSMPRFCKPSMMLSSSLWGV